MLSLSEKRYPVCPQYGLPIYLGILRGLTTLRRTEKNIPIMDHLENKDLEPVIANIRNLMANLHVHYQNVRNFHWNVTGRQFVELHKHLEGLYERIAEVIDVAAERLRALGTYPNQTLQEYIIMAEIQDQVQVLEPIDMLEILKESSELIARNMQKIVKSADEVGDYGSSDIFSTLLGEAEKEAWMLRALLQ